MFKLPKILKSVVVIFFIIFVINIFNTNEILVNANSGWVDASNRLFRDNWVLDNRTDVLKYEINSMDLEGGKLSIKGYAFNYQTYHHTYNNHNVYIELRSWNTNKYKSYQAELVNVSKTDLMFYNGFRYCNNAEYNKLADVTCNYYYDYVGFKIDIPLDDLQDVGNYDIWLGVYNYDFSYGAMYYAQVIYPINITKNSTFRSYALYGGYNSINAIPNTTSVLGRTGPGKHNASIAANTYFQVNGTYSINNVSSLSVDSPYGNELWIGVNYSGISNRTIVPGNGGVAWGARNFFYLAGTPTVLSIQNLYTAILTVDYPSNGLIFEDTDEVLITGWFASTPNTTDYIYVEIKNSSGAVVKQGYATINTYRPDVNSHFNYTIAQKDYAGWDYKFWGSELGAGNYSVTTTARSIDGLLSTDTRSFGIKQGQGSNTAINIIDKDFGGNVEGTVSIRNSNCTTVVKNVNANSITKLDLGTYCLVTTGISDGYDLPINKTVTINQPTHTINIDATRQKANFNIKVEDDINKVPIANSEITIYRDGILQAILTTNSSGMVSYDGFIGFEYKFVQENMKDGYFAVTGDTVKKVASMSDGNKTFDVTFKNRRIISFNADRIVAYTSLASEDLKVEVYATSDVSELEQEILDISVGIDLYYDNIFIGSRSYNASALPSVNEFSIPSFYLTENDVKPVRAVVNVIATSEEGINIITKELVTNAYTSSEQVFDINQNNVMADPFSKDSNLQTTTTTFEYSGVIKTIKEWDKPMVEYKENITVEIPKIPKMKTGHGFYYPVKVEYTSEADTIDDYSYSFNAYASSKLIDTELDYPVIDDKSIINLEQFENEFKLPNVNILERSGVLLSDYQISNNTYTDRILQGGNRFFIPTWLDLGVYDFNVVSEDGIGINQINLNITDNIDVYAYMYATLESESYKDDQYWWRPATACNPFPTGIGQTAIENGWTDELVSKYLEKFCRR